MGFAENAMCPRCRTYTRQRIVSRGERECDCGERFKLKDTVRVQKGRVIRPTKKK